MKYFILITVLLVSGCKSKKAPINYMLLQKHSGKTPVSYKVIEGKVKNIYIYRETYLIDNLPERTKKKEIDTKVYSILFNYVKKHHKICLLEDDISGYSVNFYRKSKCTDYFIDNFQDTTGISQTTFSDCEEDGEYTFYYERDKDNPNMWTNALVAQYWDKKYRDTIYCNPNAKKIRLPDKPRS